MLDFRFEPATVTVPPGGALRIVNDGATEHTFTFPGAPAPIDVLLSPGQSREVNATTTEGTTRFYCRLHASAGSSTGMVGDLVVKAATAGGDATGGGDAEGGSSTSKTPLAPLLGAAAAVVAGLARRR